MTQASGPAAGMQLRPEMTFPLVMIGPVLWFAACVRYSSTCVSQTSSRVLALRPKTNSSTLVSVVVDRQVAVRRADPESPL